MPLLVAPLRLLLFLLLILQELSLLFVMSLIVKLLLFVHLI